MAAVRRGDFPPQQRQQQFQHQPQQPGQDGQPPGQDGVLKVAAVQPSAVGPGGDRRTRSGKFTLAQLRQTDGIVPLQSGTNQFDSQRGKTGFGMPRNTSTKIVFADDGKRYQVEELTQRDNLIRLQSGTNKFDSQKGMTNFGTPRDVKGKHLKRIWELEFPEEELNERPVNAQQQQQQAQQGQQGFYAPPGPPSPASPQQRPSPRGPPAPPQQQQFRQPPHIRPQ